MGQSLLKIVIKANSIMVAKGEYSNFAHILIMYNVYNQDAQYRALLWPTPQCKGYHANSGT
jgi:hypothetical protein